MSIRVCQLDGKLLVMDREWISVKDKLPEDERRVAILYRYKENPRLIPFIAEYSPFDEQWRNSLKNITITHWMAFPDPPEQT